MTGMVWKVDTIREAYHAAALNNETWPAGAEAVSSLPWPRRDAYDSIHNFLILKRRERVAIHIEPPHPLLACRRSGAEVYAG